MNFIAPNINIDSVSQADWVHFANLKPEQLKARWQTPQGIELRKKLIEQRFDREQLSTLVGQFSGHYDLRGISLAGVNLSHCDLSAIDFFVSDFSNANLTGCDLSNSYLSESNISGAKFDWAELSDALLDNVKFNQDTSFLGVKLHTVNFTLATLLHDLAVTQQRIQQLEKHHKWFAAFLRLSSDYGRSFNRYMLWVVVFVFSYSFIYWKLMDKPFLDCLYFSLVTFATVGYGDILPITALQKLIVMSEIGIGYLMGGLLVAILAKRVLG
ncbi:MAG: ion channel [Methylobacter sp.]